MKTPKRDYKGELVCPATGELNEYVTEVQETRWKRKNRTAQLKRTIARLTQELWRERENRRCILAEYARLAQIARNAKQGNNRKEQNHGTH